MCCHCWGRCAWSPLLPARSSPRIFHGGRPAGAPGCHRPAAAPSCAFPTLRMRGWRCTSKAFNAWLALYIKMMAGAAASVAARTPGATLPVTPLNWPDDLRARLPRSEAHGPRGPKAHSLPGALLGRRSRLPRRDHRLPRRDHLPDGGEGKRCLRGPGGGRLSRERATSDARRSAMGAHHGGAKPWWTPPPPLPPCPASRKHRDTRAERNTDCKKNRCDDVLTACPGVRAAEAAAVALAVALVVGRDGDPAAASAMGMMGGSVGAAAFTDGSTAGGCVGSAAPAPAAPPFPVPPGAAALAGVGGGGCGAAGAGASGSAGRGGAAPAG